MEEVLLNDSWTLYFHDPYDEDWSAYSYKRLGIMMSIQEFWEGMHAIGNGIVSGAFFIMRQDIIPQWEDPNNVDGGTISIKILKKEVLGLWEEMCALTLGESLMIDNLKFELVNGISISPKKHFCVIKIWLKDVSFLTDVKSHLKIPTNYNGDFQVRKNKDGSLVSTGSLQN